MEKKKILVISPYYAPEQHPRPHRWSAICGYLATQGHEIHVITGQYPGQEKESIMEGVKVHRVGYAGMKGWLRMRKGAELSPQGKSKRGGGGFVSKSLFKAFNQIIRPCMFPDEMGYFFNSSATSFALKLMESTHFDQLITVSKPFSTHLIGFKIKEAHPDLFWLTDHGDSYSVGVQPPVLKFWHAQARFMEEQVYTHADAFCVTNQQMAALYRTNFGERKEMRVVPPLLHPFPEEPNADSPSGVPILVSFFGSLYRPERPPEVLIRFCEQLMASNPTIANKVEVRIYGTVQADIVQDLSQTPLIRLMGNLPRDQVRPCMEATHVLLNIGNDVPFLLPSKVADYLAAARPILHLSQLESDAFSDLVTQLGQSMEAVVMRDGVFAEGDIKKAWDFIQDAQTEVCKPIAGLNMFSIEHIAESYL